ncbi:helix-turn-helix domain-containing protein [Mucilaginibacter pallidiroseus]|uniref:Helix-turn-helix domain-containing protein n=1 Tax=Mucilaginibacter pallidiroseus TaxID=2599295 RepID=A0A563U7P7_9SPHI|nr:helix-turn-helix transcriptional regulator [Mucilaginibacter pallidiroseus]TWR27370.1 helix-turn-helix domain-containing protein [Mucilaginibacter pallidiroseus]
MIEQHYINDYAPGLTDTISGGNFAAVKLDDFSAESVAATRRYSRKDFYKISLLTGHSTYHYRDVEHNFKSGEWALAFTNRDVPYRWEVHSGSCSGYACMFTEDFLPLHTHIRPADWAVFNGAATPVYRLSLHEQELFENLFKRMLAEQDSVYEHKYQLLFLYVLECIHLALKLQPEPDADNKQTAAFRLAQSFKTLLAGQFPLVEPVQKIKLRTPQHFADKLAVHTNSLNRALKDVTGKTTSQLINERIMQEARALLKYSNWSIGQISNCLGFEEPTHFTRAFKASTGQTPSSVRQLV